MRPDDIIVQGTVKPDGTLERDQNPSLSPGRVTVVSRHEAEAPAPGEGSWPYMQRVPSEREAASRHFLNEGEMQAHRDWLREEEARINRVHREIDIEKRIAEQS